MKFQFPKVYLSHYYLSIYLIKHLLYYELMNAFAALSDPTRRDIVKLVVMRGELTSSEISQNFDMSSAAISQHLKILKESRILQMKKDAQKRIYSLSDGMNEVEDWIEEIKTLWSKRLNNYEKYVLKMKKERDRDKK